MDSAHPWIRTRLSIMMFIEFFVYACWMSPLGTYMGKTLQLSGAQIGWVYSVTALAAIISPLFVGYIADRLFATERILCVLHLVGAVCLCLAAEITRLGPTHFSLLGWQVDWTAPQTHFAALMALMMINALCFMPALALGNSLAFRNIPDPEKFPRIAMLGTIGWIVSGWIVGIAIGETNKGLFYLGGGAGILMALYCLTLPHTPPKGREAGGDVLGLGALTLLKDPAFLGFVVAAFLISIPATFYFPLCNPYLAETERPAPTTLMTLGQFTEIFVMFTMPWFIGRLGLRRILLIGMAVWAIRYVLFATLSFPLVLLGLLVHGFGYCFVYVGSYIYVDKNAPRDLRASAQSFISFLMLGVGWFLGSQLAGYTHDRYLPMQATDEQGQVVAAPMPRWSAEANEEKPDLGSRLDANGDGQITAADRAAIPEAGLTIDGKTYSRDDLLAAFDKVAQWKIARGTAKAKDEPILRGDWVTVQSHRWTPIWLWPAAAAAIVALLFLFVPSGKPQAQAPG